MNSVTFRTSDMEDSWILPSLSTSSDNSIPAETDMPFPATLVTYQVNLDHVVDPSPSSSWIEEEGGPLCAPCLGSRVISLLRLP